MNGKPFFSEVDFCHTPSKTMIMSDFFWNWPNDVPAATRAFKFGMDVLYKPLYFNFMIKDKGARTLSAVRICSVEALVALHGCWFSALCAVRQWGPVLNYGSNVSSQSLTPTKQDVFHARSIASRSTYLDIDMGQVKVPVFTS